MPELPEVETVRRGLHPHLHGAILTRVAVRRPDLRFPLPNNFAERLTGARIVSLGRRGKFLQATLAQGETLVMHMGMSGRFLVETDGEELSPGSSARTAAGEPRHTHVVFETATARVGFSDPRRFGYMALLPTADLDRHPWFARLGPEPLESGFDARWLQESFRGRRQAVKVLLLDQRVVAGVGNIYACEALHRARIWPGAPAGELRGPALRRLAAAVRRVLAEAIEAGGSSLRDYAQVDGGLGYFQHAFRVYDRAGAACARPRCNGRVERMVQAGRATFFCSACQAP